MTVSPTDRRGLMPPVNQWSGARATLRPTESHWEACAPLWCVTDRSAQRRVLRIGWSWCPVELLVAFTRRPCGNMPELLPNLKAEADTARGVWGASQSRGTYTEAFRPDQSVVREVWSSPEMRVTRLTLSRPFTLIRFTRENITHRIGFHRGVRALMDT